VFLLQGAALGISAAATPGPLQTFLVSQTLFWGWKRGAPVAFAPLVSDPPLVLLIVFILGQLPAAFLNLISIFGGLFALYIAYGLFRSWINDSTQSPSQDITKPPAGSGSGEINAGENVIPVSKNQSTIAILAKGVIMNVMSPGLYMFWALISGPLLLSAVSESTLSGISFLVGFYTMLTGGLLLLVLIFNFARRLGPRVVRILTLCSIFILTVFGIILIYQGILRLIE